MTFSGQAYESKASCIISGMTRPKEQLAALCHHYQIHILYAFGSRARQMLKLIHGELERLPAGDSDGDIGVKPAVPLTVKQKVMLTQALEDLFGLTRIDLVVLPEADPFLAANIIRGERLFADDEYLAAEYDLYILRRAGDLAPLERERQALILQEGGSPS